MSHGPAARVCIFFCWFLGFPPPKKKEKRKINKDVRMGLINVVGDKMVVHFNVT